LVIGSVVPVVISITIIWQLLGLTPGGVGLTLLLGAGFLSIVTPYLVGWIRSFLGLVALAVALLAISQGLQGEAAILVIMACLGAAAAICGLVWYSLRFGHVWRPADARYPPAAKGSG
jgi:hypothetical protein